MSIIEDPKMAIATGVTTSVSGLNTALSLDLIPTDIGKLATCAGIVLSCVMIKYWIQKLTIERKESKLGRQIQEAELQILLHELREKKESSSEAV